MEHEAIHYDVIRDNNRKLVRNLVRKHVESSKRELVTYSGLSFPTVGTAIRKLVERKEIVADMGESTGGRPSAVFRMNPDYMTFVCASLVEYDFTVKVYNYCGELQKQFAMTIPTDADENTFLNIFKTLKLEYENLMLAIIGIPGVAVNGLIKHLPYLSKLQNRNLMTLFKEKLNITLFLENDINMIAMGELDMHKDFAHILWNQNCIGSAIVLNGTIVRGNHGCAGEIEIVSDLNTERDAYILKALLAIEGVVDVPLIAISGTDITEKIVFHLKNELQKHMPEFRIPEVRYVTDEKERYELGLLQVAFTYCSQL